MAEKLVEYPIEVLKERGENTLEVGVLGRKVQTELTDGRIESSVVFRHYVLYGGEIEAATTRRSGVRVPNPLDLLEKLSAGGEVSFVPEQFSTNPTSLAYPAHTRAEIIRPSQEEAAQGKKPVLRLRIPLKQR